jgi:hypothetical protein
MRRHHSRAIEGGDHLIEDLARLTPDTLRNATTVARCHDRLAARRRTIEARNRAPMRAFGAERLLAAGFCVAYLIAMADYLLAIAARR